jgi:ribose transport system substrate-binding protein
MASAGAMLVALALVGAACGSSAKKTATATPNATTANAGGDGSAAVAQAKAAVAKYQQRPTTINFNVPVGKPIPTGKKIDFINCGSSACNLEGNIIKQAADVLGWTLKVLNTDGTPQQVQNAWQQVGREKPDGVLYTAVPRAEIEQYLKNAAQQGIGVAACCLTDQEGDGIDYIIGKASQGAQLGPAYASWVVADSNAKAKTIFLTLPDFPILTTVENAYHASLTKMCPTCGYDKLDIPLADLGKNAPDLIISYLRSHPDTKYVVASVDAIVLGLPAALKAAGLNDIKLIGEGPNTTNLQYIASGQQAASVAFPYYEEMYAMVDALARKFAGVPIVEAFDPPVWLLTKDNVPSTTELFPLVLTTKDQFAKLWGKA